LDEKKQLEKIEGTILTIIRRNQSQKSHKI